MIKIKSLFSTRANIKEIEASNDQVLPKISFLRQNKQQSKYNAAWMYPMNHETPQQNSAIYKNQSATRYQQSFLHENRSFLFKNSSIANSDIFPHNRVFTSSRSKIDAKQFKFLSLEKNNLKQAIHRYLQIGKLPKKQYKKLNQKIIIPKVMLEDNDMLRIRMEGYDKSDENEDQHGIKISIKSLIDSITENIEFLFKNRLHKEFRLKEHIKKIVLITQKIIQRLKNTHTQNTAQKGKTQIVSLNSYIADFISEFDKENIEARKTNEFYRSMFDKYEKVPFYTIEQKEQIISQEVPIIQQIKQVKKAVKMRRFQFIDRLNNYNISENDDSLVKNKFYNNMKKQVNFLQQETDKIMRNEFESV